MPLATDDPDRTLIESPAGYQFAVLPLERSFQPTLDVEEALPRAVLEERLDDRPGRSQVLRHDPALADRQGGAQCVDRAMQLDADEGNAVAVELGVYQVIRTQEQLRFQAPR
jgi:hypothetical protein